MEQAPALVVGGLFGTRRFCVSSGSVRVVLCGVVK
jgi:hypothetical protein